VSSLFWMLISQAFFSEFTQGLSPRTAHLTRNRGMCAYLLACRGLGAAGLTVLDIKSPVFGQGFFTAQKKELAKYRPSYLSHINI
jgi:hypothetical protein